MTCETFIPGFTGDLYGTDPVVEFHAYLSPSKSSTRWMSCASASTTQPGARRNTSRSELYEKAKMYQNKAEIKKAVGGIIR